MPEVSVLTTLLHKDCLESRVERITGVFNNTGQTVKTRMIDGNEYSVDTSLIGQDGSETLVFSSHGPYVNGLLHGQAHKSIFYSPDEQLARSFVAQYQHGFFENEQMMFSRPFTLINEKASGEQQISRYGNHNRLIFAMYQPNTDYPSICIEAERVMVENAQGQSSVQLGKIYAKYEIRPTPLDPRCLSLTVQRGTFDPSHCLSHPSEPGSYTQYMMPAVLAKTLPDLLMQETLSPRTLAQSLQAKSIQHYQGLFQQGKLQGQVRFVRLIETPTQSGLPYDSLLPMQHKRVGTFLIGSGTFESGEALSTRCYSAILWYFRPGGLRTANQYYVKQLLTPSGETYSWDPEHCNIQSSSDAPPDLQEWMACEHELRQFLPDWNLIDLSEKTASAQLGQLILQRRQEAQRDSAALLNQLQLSTFFSPAQPPPPPVSVPRVKERAATAAARTEQEAQEARAELEAEIADAAAKKSPQTKVTQSKHARAIAAAWADYYSQVTALRKLPKEDPVVKKRLDNAKRVLDLLDKASKLTRQETLLSEVTGILAKSKRQPQASAASQSRPQKPAPAAQTEQPHESEDDEVQAPSEAASTPDASSPTETPSPTTPMSTSHRMLTLSRIYALGIQAQLPPEILMLLSIQLNAAEAVDYASRASNRFENIRLFAPRCLLSQAEQSAHIATQAASDAQSHAEQSLAFFQRVTADAATTARLAETSVKLAGLGTRV